MGDNKMEQMDTPSERLLKGLHGWMRIDEVTPESVASIIDAHASSGLKNTPNFAVRDVMLNLKDGRIGTIECHISRLPDGTLWFHQYKVEVDESPVEGRDNIVDFSTYELQSDGSWISRKSIEDLDASTEALQKSADGVDPEAFYRYRDVEKATSMLTTETLDDSGIDALREILEGSSVETEPRLH